MCVSVRLASWLNSDAVKLATCVSLACRYLIMVDGNAAPSARSLKSMSGDSLLLWLASEYREPGTREASVRLSG